MPCAKEILLHAVGSPALVWAVNCWPVTTEGWVQSQASQDGICSVRSGTGTGLSPSTSVVPCQYHSTTASYSFIYL